MKSLSHKKKVIELMQKQYWKNEAQFRKFPEGELKKYIELKLTEILTPEVVNTCWDKSNN